MSDEQAKELLVLLRQIAGDIASIKELVEEAKLSGVPMFSAAHSG